VNTAIHRANELPKPIWLGFEGAPGLLFVGVEKKDRSLKATGKMLVDIRA
jgi:hypothetical protein